MTGATEYRKGEAGDNTGRWAKQSPRRSHSSSCLKQIIFLSSQSPLVFLSLPLPLPLPTSLSPCQPLLLVSIPIACPHVGSTLKKYDIPTLLTMCTIQLEPGGCHLSVRLLH